MSENAEAATRETGAENSENVLDFVLGGENSHSPEAVSSIDFSETELGPEAEDTEVPEEFEDESDRFEDSAEVETEQVSELGEEPAPEKETPSAADDAVLKQEIETLNKRLKDTQAAMHKATSERASLQKELEELKRKKEDEDDWFSEADENRAEVLEQQIETSNQEVKALEEKAALSIWDTAVSQVKKDHPDFDEVVYEGLSPKLDEVTGDARVRMLWAAEPDKSPASAYAFAKKVEDLLLMQDDPAAYRAKIRAEVENEYKNTKKTESSTITGKDGLDLLNSAETAEQEIDTGGSVIDFVLS